MSQGNKRVDGFKELSEELKACDDYVIKEGRVSGTFFAVFPSEYERKIAETLEPRLWRGLQIACFGAPYNAFELTAWWRMLHPFQFEMHVSRRER